MRTLTIPGLSRTFLYTVLVLSALVDIPRRFSLGSVTGLAALTLVCAVVPLFFWAADARLLQAVPTLLWPFLLFIVWGFLSMSWHPPTVPGLQSLLVPTVFLFLMALTYHHSRHAPPFAPRIMRLMPLIATAPVALYGLSMVLDRRIESFLLMGARSFALYALICLAWHLASWRYGHPRGLLGSLFTVAVIGLSLSRTALASALLLFPLARMSLKNRWGVVPVLLLVVLLGGGLYQAVYLIEPLRARFLEGDTSLSIGGVAINATGRTGVWQAVMSSAWQAPLVGQGIGSADEVVDRVLPGLGHPHCDYLRLFHDLGLLGLGAWLIGYLLLLRATARAWAHAERASDPMAVLHLTAFLSLLGIAMGMATDNPIVYWFLMAPLGIIVGTSLGQASARRASSPPA